MSRAAFGVGVLGLLAALCVGTLYGAAHIPPDHVFGIVAQRLGLSGAGGWRPWEAIVVLDVRLPRVLVGAFVGGGLAVCGLVMQSLFRNSLADPGVLGVSSGASLGAVIALCTNWAARSEWALPACAVVGAAATAGAIYTLSARRGHIHVGTLLLVGVAVGSFTSAATSMVLSLALANYDTGRQIVFWMLGGLDARTWQHVLLIAPPTLMAVAIAMIHVRDLDALLLGEIQAASLGVDVPRCRWRLIGATSLMVGAAVAVSGVIGFVGLIVPHMLRLLLGPAHRLLLPTCLLVGAAFIVLADLAARTLIAPEEIRLGIITASVGAPFFLWLLLKKRADGVI